MRFAIALLGLALIGAAPVLAQTATPAAPAAAPRPINVTADSARGWLPTAELGAAAEQAATRYFAARDAGRFQEAFALLTDSNRALQSFDEYKTQSEALRTSTGSVVSRTLTQTTWTKDSPRAPAPGVYAAIDFTSRYEKADRECGYLILYQPPAGGPFQVMREERIVLDNATAARVARELSPLEVVNLWSELSANCPNYRAPQQ